MGGMTCADPRSSASAPPRPPRPAPQAARCGSVGGNSRSAACAWAPSAASFAASTAASTAAICSRFIAASSLVNDVWSKLRARARVTDGGVSPTAIDDASVAPAAMVMVALPPVVEMSPTETLSRPDRSLFAPMVMLEPRAPPTILNAPELGGVNTEQETPTKVTPRDETGVIADALIVADSMFVSVRVNVAPNIKLFPRVEASPLIAGNVKVASRSTIDNAAGLKL